MRRALLLVTVLLFTREAYAQQPNYADLLRRVCAHEKEALKDRRWFRFFAQTEFEWGTQTRAVVETSEGHLQRIVALNGQPLAADQEEKQQERLKRLLRDSAALSRELSAQRDEDKRRDMMVAALPEAFVLEFSRLEMDGRLKFSFRPDPNFYPTSRETQVLKGISGWIWIDARSERITEIQGELFKDVSFGWGLLGRLNKGGTFRIVQSQIIPGLWRITNLNLDLRGKLLLFKSLRVLQKENFRAFIPNPPEMDAHKALELLLGTGSSASGTQASVQPNRSPDTKNTKQNR